MEVCCLVLLEVLFLRLFLNTFVQYDVAIVGAGPAGLASAIRLKQLCLENEIEMSICVLEKGAEVYISLSYLFILGSKSNTLFGRVCKVGAHILSGNVFEPRALDELFPDWRQMQKDGSGSLFL